jgi:adenosylcobinamide-phosphate synthase
MGVRLGMPILDGGVVTDRPDLGLGEPADTGHLDSTVGLVWRALAMWLLLLLLLSRAAAVS